MRLLHLDFLAGSGAMGSSTLLIISFICILNPMTASSSSSYHSDARNSPQSSQETTVTTVDPPITPSSEPTLLDSNSSRLPKVRPPPFPYMMELYNQYQSGEMRNNYKKHSNIVRSILPSRGKVNKDDILVFNLSVMLSSERLQRAELHLHNHHPTMDGKEILKELRMTLYNMVTPKAHLLTTVTNIKPTPGTQTLDVTESVAAFIKTNRDERALILGLRIDETNGKNGYKVIPKTRFRKLISQSFLTIFSKERSLGNGEEVIKHSLDIAKARQRNKPNPLRESGKRKRSVVDNELPDSALRLNDVIANGSLESLRTLMTQRKLDSRIIPRPEIIKPHKPFGQQRKHNRKRRGKARKLPEIWQEHVRRRREDYFRLKNESFGLKNESEINSEGSCRLEELVVNIEDIGWNKWIIAPDKLQVNYCTGVCSDPLSKYDQFTNHAVMQSLAFQLYSDVPEPCCSPQSLKSITVLYLHEDGIILKVYSNMKVESCACR